MSAWEYSCHVEVYKWYLDDCQDDEEPLETPLTFLIYPLLHAVEKIGLWSSEYINQFMAVWSLDKEHRLVAPLTLESAVRPVICRKIQKSDTL